MHHVLFGRLARLASLQHKVPGVGHQLWLMRAGREVVGRKIAVWKPKAGIWRNGTVSDFNSINLRHVVRLHPAPTSESLYFSADLTHPHKLMRPYWLVAGCMADLSSHRNADPFFVVMAAVLQVRYDERGAREEEALNLGRSRFSWLSEPAAGCPSNPTVVQGLTPTGKEAIDHKVPPAASPHQGY